MAEMVPDRLSPGVSTGERRVFEVLQRLPDDCIVYYEPVVSRRYPDFVVIIPDMGMMVFEVKSWRIQSIISANGDEVRTRTSSGEEVFPHPIRQARRYMFNLLDRCKSEAPVLLRQEGPYAGKLYFPLAHCVILTQISKQQLENHPSENLRRLFPIENTITNDILAEWAELSSVNLLECMRIHFDPFWNFPRMPNKDIDILRSILHPEAKIDPAPSQLAIAWYSDTQPQTEIGNAKTVPSGPSSLRVLDLEQERDARAIGDGHRIVYGVAGAGKTVLLLARARLVAEAYPKAKFLVICFNISLASYFRSVLARYPSITVHHFHEWARANGCYRHKADSDEVLGRRLLEKLQQGEGQEAHYDAIFVDEAQDFEPLWFECLLCAMKEPADGHLFVVADGSQGLYERYRVTWKSLGIYAQGRTRKLTRNYRNTRELIEAAQLFASSNEQTDDDYLQAMVPQPSQAIRSSGHLPILVQAESLSEECALVVGRVEELLRGKWNDQDVEPLRPSDIGILYPQKNNPESIDKLIHSLRSTAPVHWLSGGGDSPKHVCSSGIKVQTIHNAKGLQYRAVFVIFSHDLPYITRDASDSQKKKNLVEVSRKLMYVAITRSEEFLIVSYVRKKASEFCRLMEASGRFQYEQRSSRRTSRCS